MVMKFWTLSAVILLAIFTLAFVAFGQDSDTDTPPEADTPVEDGEEEIAIDVDETTKYVRINGVWYKEVDGVRTPVPPTDLTIVRTGTGEDGLDEYTMPTSVVTAPRPPKGDGILTRIRPASSTNLPLRAVWVPKHVLEPPVVSVPIGAAWKDTSDLTITVNVSSILKSGNFITSDSKHFVTAITEAEEVNWEATAKNGAGPLNFKPSNSKTPKVIFSPVVSTVGTAPIAYIVKGDTEFAADSDSFKQNNLNQLRQEYVNLNKDTTPKMADFDQVAPYHRKLLDKPGDVHDHHEHWMLTTVNSKAKAFKKKFHSMYDNKVFFWMSGYRCPVRNKEMKAAVESQHIYGTALDVDIGSNTPPENSQWNHRLFIVGKDSLDATGAWLYDQNDKRIKKEIPAWGTYPEGVTKYTRVHLDWRVVE